MFESIEQTINALNEQKYICDKQVATVVFLASRMKKPILIEGPAGVGKTDLAKVVAKSLGLDLIRLQCYEGLDESKALYEWEYAKQLLYTQILKDKISETLQGANTLHDAVERIKSQDNVFFSEDFILPRPLLNAVMSEKQVLLLIDEVDKSDSEFEAFLLEILSDFQVSVPELGTIVAKHIPLVFLTSNNTREMTDALKRRCMHLFIDFPEKEREAAIVRMKVPEISETVAAQLVAVVQSIRSFDLKKMPSISETLDWAKALAILNADSLDEELVKSTLSLILKYEGEIRKAEREMDTLMRIASEAGAAPSGIVKDRLN